MKIFQKANNYYGDLIETTLENRDIADQDLFLNPDDTIYTHSVHINRIEEGIELLQRHLIANNKIAILVDQDADGFMSSSLLYRFLNEYSATTKDLHYILHDTKAHGLTEKVMAKIYEMNPRLVIIPDAGSNDTAQIEELEAKKINVLVIDHHQVTQFTDKGVIINNQLSPMANKHFVGVGMVYKFIEAINNQYHICNLDNFLDVVSLGQIADASDIADPEIRYIVLKGLDNIQNNFLKVSIGQKNGFGVQLAPKDMSFGVIPLINSVTRVGELWEREVLFKALSHIDDGSTYEVIKKKKDKETGKFNQVTFNFNIYEYAYEVASKCKSRQDAAVKKLVVHIEDTIVDDAGVIIAFSGDTENPGITGLVANKIMSKYDKPTLLLNEQEETFTGSGRGHEKTMKDFRSWCEKSDLVEFAQGHDNAFGICIRKDRLNEFKEYSRKVEKQELVYEVDIITDKPVKEHCETVDGSKRLFGGSVSEPFIGIVGLSVPKRFISVKGSMLTIFSWGVSCVMFSAPVSLYDKLMSSPDEYVVINMVGFYGMNDWNGRKTPQFMIKDIEVVEKNTSEEVTVDNIVF
ncbi:MAG TPA: DHH family phosphoesterase [Pseudoneobacillus sp.]|nr:DHH family phosphoesterase [Pseudoneobacillus sp.]